LDTVLLLLFHVDRDATSSNNPRERRNEEPNLHEAGRHSCTHGSRGAVVTGKLAPAARAIELTFLACHTRTDDGLEIATAGNVGLGMT